ncbi:MAG: DUF4838 domain-containing protein [Ruminococcaceae bacterium]|nr:DUF4838 domain-containing protein [Oscillospiraceae bacterium]
MKIYKISSNETMDYGAMELKKYLHMMMPDAGLIKIAYNPNAQDGFRLGLMQDFGLDVSDVENPELDDILYIKTDEHGGIIAGDNYRSVLLAVYEYLRQNGCRWLMPGKNGEFIPMQEIVPVEYRHKATTRFRGWCNEGSISQKSILDFIEFTPKIGMNTVKMQWRLPYGFYERHYEHIHNKENRSLDSVCKPQMLQWTKECEEEIKMRGLTLFVLGHGVTIDGIGMDASACWKMADEDIPQEVRPFLALRNGERTMFGGVPTNTNLCMSNPESRRRCVDYLVDYITTHTNADYFMIGLADGMNNHCECENCRKQTPSDWYILWLNELDEALTKAGSDAKLCFSMYVDCCFPPKYSKIKNPQRFVMTTGFSSRTYTRTLRNDGSEVIPPTFSLNHNTMAKDLDEAFALRRNYLKTAFDGKITLASEYHFWYHRFLDVADSEMPKRLEEDLKAYKEEGFGGMIHFICPRHSFPNGHSFYSHARNAFDDSLSLEEIRKDYFSCAYGEWADEAADLFDRLGHVFDFDYAEGEKGNEKGAYCNPQIAEQLKGVQALSEEAIALSEKMNKPLPAIMAIHRKLLYYYGIYFAQIGNFLHEKAKGENQKAKELFETFRLEFGKLEAEIEDYYDHHMVIKSLRLISEDLGFEIQ